MPTLLAAPIPHMLGTTVALTLAALAWGFVNFGVLLWLPSALVAEGRSVAAASTLIARSALIAAPTIVAATYLYSVWSTKSSLMLAIGITTLGLAAILLRSTGAAPIVSNPLVPLTLLIVGSSAVISILLPYATENYPIRVRGRATGWVAGWSKIGGLVAQGLSALALVPALGLAAAVVAIPALVSLALIGFFGRETRGRDLRDLEAVRAGAQ
jgi:putative MFS transporter